MLRYLFFFFSIVLCLDLYSQGATNNQFEVISRVYFGSLPFDSDDIMNPSSGTNPSQCTGYSDFTVGNSNSGDGNTTGLIYSTNVTLNETYSLEVEGEFCSSSIPSVVTPNRSFKVYIDYDANGTFDDDELILTSPFYQVNNPIFNTTITIPNDATIGETKMRIVYNRVEYFTFLWINDLFQQLTIQHLLLIWRN